MEDWAGSKQLLEALAASRTPLLLLFDSLSPFYFQRVPFAKANESGLLERLVRVCVLLTTTTTTKREKLHRPHPHVIGIIYVQYPYAFVIVERLLKAC